MTLSVSKKMTPPDYINLTNLFDPNLDHAFDHQCYYVPGYFKQDSGAHSIGKLPLMPLHSLNLSQPSFLSSLQWTEAPLGMPSI